MTENLQSNKKFTFNELVEYNQSSDTGRYYLLVEYDVPFSYPYLKIFNTYFELSNYAINRFYSKLWPQGIKNINYESYKIDKMIFFGSYNNVELIIYAHTLNEQQLNNWLHKTPKKYWKKSRDSDSSDNSNSSDSSDSSDSDSSDSDK